MIGISVTRPGSEPLHTSFTGVRIGIGRGDDNELVLADKSCSRNHAEIVCDRGVYRIVDLGSANGIRVDGAKVAEHVLSNGLSVKLGESVLTFSLEDDAVDGTMLLPDVADRTVLVGREQVVPGESPPAAVPKTPVEPAILFLNYRERQEERSFRLVEGVEYVLGRSPNADLVLGDKKSSKRHATIFSKDGAFFIRDLGSANKTFVNGKAIQESPLALDDEIRVGDAVFRVSKEKASLEDESFLLARTQLGLPAGVLAELGVGPQPHAPTRRRRPLLLAVTAGVAALALGVAGYWFFARTESAASDAGQGTAVAGQIVAQVAPVAAKELVFDISATGSLKAERSTTVSAEIPGRVVEVLVDEGATVLRGQELVRLNDRDIRLQIEEARSSLTEDQVQIAKDDYDRKRRLFESGVITRSVFDMSKNNHLSLESKYQSLQANVKLLGEQLAKTRVAAPMPGVVAKRSVEAGEFVGPGSPLFVLDSMGEVLLEADVSDRDVVKVRPGQPVEVTSDAFPGRTFAGTVDQIGSAANSVTKTFKVQARIPNPDLSLRSGMIASLRIVLDAAKGLVVPADALMAEDGSDGAEVFVVEDGVARRRSIRIGRRLDREVQVMEGLTEGQQVVVYGQDRVTDGAAVQSFHEP